MTETHITQPIPSQIVDKMLRMRNQLNRHVTFTHGMRTEGDLPQYYLGIDAVAREGDIRYVLYGFGENYERALTDFCAKIRHYCIEKGLPLEANPLARTADARPRFQVTDTNGKLRFAPWPTLRAA